MFKKVVLLALVLTLIGCGTAQTVVMNPVEKNIVISGVSVEADNHNIEVPEDIVQKLQAKIEEGLYKDNRYQRSRGLKIVYRFLQQDKGNQLARWFWGGIGNAGEASLTVLVRYLDVENNELGKIQVQGKIDSGFFGGSFTEAITKAADEIVKFTVVNFPPIP